MPAIKKHLLLGLAGAPALLALLATTPAAAQDSFSAYRPYHQYEHSSSPHSDFRVWIGGFRPDATGAYFTEVRNDFTGDQSSDLTNVIGGVDWRLHLNPYASLLFSGSIYEGSTTQSYRAFMDNNGDRIRHNQTLDIDSLTAALMVNLAPPRSPVMPYVGAGGGLYYYRLREAGDFIDFTQNPPPVFNSVLESSGTTLGYFVLAGLDIPVARRTSVFFEGRLSRATKDLSQDFSDFGKINLNGKQFEVGVSWSLY